MRLLLVLLASCSQLVVVHGAPTKSPPPNILLIVSDDQAWTDYGFMGHPQIETPVLDRLASESLTYTRGYVTAPLCRPSLASIFTGLPAHRHGITGNDLVIPGSKLPVMANRRGDAEQAVHEQLYAGFGEHPGLAKLLKSAGYRSLQTGKWWEGDPKRFGFTHAMTHGDPQRGGRHGDEGLKISREGIQPIRDFLDEVQAEKQPFFIWHAPFLPHSPHNPPAALLAKYQALVDSVHVARYHAMVEWFDQTCGELLLEIEERGLGNNTVILYVTDNGWIQSPDSPRYAPRSKQDAHDGGVRTPILVRWPGHIEPDRDDRTLVSSLDIAPTILKIAGVTVPDSMPGIDLRDREALRQRDAVFGADHAHNINSVDDRTGNLESRFIVQGEWKLLLHGTADAPTEVELYHIAKDPLEEHDLARDHPERVEELTKRLNAWWADPPTSKP